MTALGAPVTGASTVRLSGAVCLAAGILGIATGVLLSVYPGQVPADVYSYPLASNGFAVLQTVLAVQHVGIVVGLLALRSAGILGNGRVGHWGWGVAVLSMLLLAATELYAIGAADATYPSARTDPLDVLYGVASVLIGAGLVATGVAVARARAWRGWRRWIVLVTGVYVFVPMLPALMGPFVVARLAITGWMLLFAALGVALLKDRRVVPTVVAGGRTRRMG